MGMYLAAAAAAAAPVLVLSIDPPQLARFGQLLEEELCWILLHYCIGDLLVRHLCMMLMWLP